MAEKLMERIRALDIEEADTREPEKDFVYVGEDEPPRYMPRSTTVSIRTAEQWERELLKDPKNQLALSALTSNDPKNVLSQRSIKVADTQNFNIKISLEGSPVTNQRSSGRCWIFAATNVFRVAIMRRYNLKEFELSQAYVYYWDKLEKANYFLEQILETTGEDLDSRVVQRLLEGPVGDGGQWDMAANVVEKYGLVPQILYPDSSNAMSSGTMNSLVTTKLRENALELRRLSRKSQNSRSLIGGVKDKMMREIHLMLTLMLGPPPNPSKEFTWEYYDKDDKFFSLKTTPLKFAAELSSKVSVQANSGADVSSFFSLVNDPRNSYGQHLSVSKLGNVIGLRPVRYVNVDMDTIKKAAIAMLRSEMPVFFGCDVGKFSNSASGIMDTGLIDYELGFNIHLGLTKAQRLMAGESLMTHAMVLTAVHVIDGKSVRWRVQNSWGEGVGTKGFFVMSDKWMDEFVYQVVVDPRFVSSETRDVLKQEPRMLPVWDPMGALA